MIFWLVMHINEAMFHGMDQSTRNFIQFMSFIELLVEAVFLVTLVVALVFSYLNKDES